MKKDRAVSQSRAERFCDVRVAAIGSLCFSEHVPSQIEWGEWQVNNGRRRFWVAACPTWYLNGLAVDPGLAIIDLRVHPQKSVTHYSVTVPGAKRFGGVYL